MKVTRRQIMKWLALIPVFVVGKFSLTAQQKRAETDVLKQFLDEGGQLVIKKQCNKMMVATEAEITGEKYHVGVYIETSEELRRRWDEIVKSSLMALRRKKTELLA